MFARILVDVDLSDKMFESVVIESEGHALSIQVQYEKYPSFCAHCRMRGHGIQNCLKLGAANQQYNAPISGKTIPVTGKVIRNQKSKVKLNSTSHLNRTVQKVVNNQEIHSSSHVAENVEKDTLVQGFTQEEVNEDVTVGPVILKGGSTLCYIDSTQCI